MADVSPKIKTLLAKGVKMPLPESVHIGDELNTDRIATTAVIHPGCRVAGSSTFIGPGCEIGEEAPATIEHCQLGDNVRLKGGYFSGATFLDGANFGSAAHVRPGTLVEEEAGGAHAVGLKQTVLFPFVTLGSLINFCDCLMAGGTSRKNHSEVGSSYIHFNYTPHQDKATASLIGDVARGVMMDQSPIFLGGQGGLVGPARIAYGNIVPAGVIQRHDALEENKILYTSTRVSSKKVAYDPEVYGDIRRVVSNNLIYIGSLVALKAWYQHVRKSFLPSDLFQGACRQLDDMLTERLKRMGELSGKIDRSAKKIIGSASLVAQQKLFVEKWPLLEKQARADVQNVSLKDRDAFLAAVSKCNGKKYIQCIQSLDADAKQNGTKWLQSIVDTISTPWQTFLGGT